MQNFGDFLRKYSRIILLLILLGISFVLIYFNNNYQRVVLFGAANTVAGSVNEKITETEDYLHLREQNQLLAEENARLRARLLADQQKVFSGTRPAVDTIYKQTYSYIPGKVINNSVDKANNYITINIGTKHGVRKDMGIITPLGAVGVVKTVSENFAVCLSLLHRKMNLNARLKGKKEFGSLTWKSTRPDKLTLDFIPTYTEVKIGDTVETTSYSSIFPEGIPIGTVSGFKVDSDEGYLTLDIKPMQSLTTISYVYAVDYIPKKEQEALEAEARKGDVE
ncbi:MAG TPA: rod shape-determining protein MreC [Bacteroidia bacterium]